MKYDITKTTAPKMPTLGKGTECIKLLLSQASKDIQEPLVPMFFPPLGAHVCGAEFQYPDNSWKEVCGLMANIVADSGGNKGQLSPLVEAICRDFRQHDKAVTDQLVEWQRQSNANGGKDSSARPNVALFFPPVDTTAAGFLLNSMALEPERRTQYFNLPEVEMADGLCGGHKKLSHMIRNIYDMARAGALRATKDGVTGNPILRASMTLSANPYSARSFYKHELFNGTFGRMVFSFKPRTSRDGRIPRQGKYDDEFYRKLDVYLARLGNCKGRFVIRPLNKLADKLAADMASLADLVDDDVLWDISKRALHSAWKDGCILWILNNQTWTKSMSELVEWLVYHDIWSKMQIFSDMLNGKDADLVSEAQRRGPKNMLANLPDTFNEAQLKALRVSFGKSEDGAKGQLSQWVFRKFVTYSEQTGLYTKTEEYLNGVKSEK